MKKIDTKSKILYVIICIIIIAGAIVYKVKGFNFDIQYSVRNQIILSNNTGFDISKIKDIARDCLSGKQVTLREVELFGNTVAIESSEITEEEKDAIIQKVNEEYNLSIASENVKILKVEHTRIRDILKPYILPGIITLAIILLYFLIRYHKIGVGKVLANGILFPIAIELVFYSIIAIFRVPFGRITMALSIGLYLIAVTILAAKFEKISEELKDIENKKENEKITG